MGKETGSMKETFLLHIRAARFWYGKYPGLFWAILASAASKAAVPYVNIYLSAQIINELAGQRQPERLWMLAAVTVLADAALALLMKALERAKNVETTWEVQDHRERKYYNEKMLDMDFAVFEAQKTREQRIRLSQETRWSGYGIKHMNYTLEEGFGGFLKVLGAVILTAELFVSKVPDSAGWMTVLNNPLMVIAIMAVLCGTTVLTPYFGAKANGFYAHFMDDVGFLNKMFEFILTDMQETANALDVRMYEQDKFSNYYTNAMADLFLEETSGFSKYVKGPIGIYNAAGAVVSVVFTGIVYVFTCLKAWAGAFGVGSVTQYVASITAMSQGLAMMIRAVGEMNNNAPALRRTFEFLDTPNVMYQGSLTTEKRSDRKYEVEFKDVSFKYPGSDVWALRHVNMKFKVGQRLAVVGENGSGKTTFIKLLCRLYDPTEGVILLNGIDIRKYKYDDYLAIFAAVFQDFQLLAFSLGENVASSHEYDEEKVQECLRKAGFGDRLETLPKGTKTALYREFDKEGVNISGGEAQKIALARALYKDSAFIILDEPTAALDPVAEYEVYTRFNEIVTDKTTIYISHRLASCRFCDDIAVFDRGSVIQQGDHDSLIAQEEGKYYALWNAQAQYYREGAAS